MGYNNPDPQDFEPPVDYNKLEHFRRHWINPPTGVYIAVDDVILVKGWSLFAVNAVNISMRILAPDGSIQTSQYTINVAANGQTPTILRIPNLEGFLLSATATLALGGAYTVFVSILLQRGVGSSDITFGQLILQGYPDSIDSLGYPQTPTQISVGARGFAAFNGIGNPVAGADFSATVPSGQHWIFRSLSIILTTAVAVANRAPTLVIDIGGNPMCVMPAVAVIVAASVVQLTWCAGANPLNTNNVQSMGAPMEFRLGPTSRIRTVTSGLQAADQYSTVGLAVDIFVGT